MAARITKRSGTSERIAGEGWAGMDDDQRRDYGERQNDPTRVLALSDGVFAIILTLLVLEIHVPELSGDQGLWDALRELRPSLVAFLISFVVVANAWARHRDLFALIRRTDRVVIWLNILYMLPLAMLPFGFVAAGPVRSRCGGVGALRVDPGGDCADTVGDLVVRDGTSGSSLRPGGGTLTPESRDRGDDSHRRVCGRNCAGRSGSEGEFGDLCTHPLALFHGDYRGTTHGASGGDGAEYDLSAF